jgi:heme/copper-type cytochrome/quinol oxidase subunit 2
MSDKTTEIYEKFAEKALGYLESTEAFLKDQLPDYFQQVVTYHAVEAWVYVGLGVICWIIACASFFRLRKENAKESRQQEEIIQTICGILMVLPMIIGLFLVTCNLPTAIKATIAPKVFIVDYLRGEE